jgi:hypothetical protein
MSHSIICEVYDSAGPGMAELICRLLNEEDERRKEEAGK